MCVLVKEWPCSTTYILRRYVFEKHVIVTRGHTLLSSVYVTKVNTRCCVYSRNTVYNWAQLLLNEVEFIHLPCTETCISPKMHEIVGLLMMQRKSPFITPVDVILPLLCSMNAAGFQLRLFSIEVAHELY